MVRDKALAARLQQENDDATYARRIQAEVTPRSTPTAKGLQSSGDAELAARLQSQVCCA